MQEDDLVKDVSTEDLLKLRFKAAKHASAMKSVKNAKDILTTKDSHSKPRVLRKSGYSMVPTPKIINNDEDDKWLDDFSDMDNESVDTVMNNSVTSSEEDHGIELNSSNFNDANEDEISLDDVSRTNHTDDEVISNEILEELGVSSPKTSPDRPNVKKPIILPGVKIHKKPISSPIVESPPEKPLGPRDSISNDASSDLELVPEPTEDGDKKIKKTRFGINLRRKKTIKATNLDEDLSRKEIAHVLYQDPSKEAEERAEITDNSLINEGYIEEDGYDETLTSSRVEVGNSMPKTVIEREEFRESLKNETEHNGTDMIFSAESIIIRNADKKPSGYSMVATITEGGYAFKRNIAEEKEFVAHDYKFGEIEKSNKAKAAGVREPRLGLIDIVSIMIIIIVIAWFFYLILIS